MMPGGANSDTLKLGYDSVTAGLSQQDGTLGNIRNRATGLLAAASVATTFAATVGLFSTAKDAVAKLPGWAPWLLMVCVLFIGVTVFIALWPAKDWTYGDDPGMVFKHRHLTPTEIYERALPSLIRGMTENERQLRQRFAAYRVGVGALIIEVLVLTVAIATA